MAGRQVPQWVLDERARRFAEDPMPEDQRLPRLLDVDGHADDEDEALPVASINWRAELGLDEGD